MKTTTTTARNANKITVPIPAEWVKTLGEVARSTGLDVADIARIGLRRIIRDFRKAGVVTVNTDSGD